MKKRKKDVEDDAVEEAVAEEPVVKKKKATLKAEEADEEEEVAAEQPVVKKKKGTRKVEDAEEEADAEQVVVEKKKQKEEFIALEEEAPTEDTASQPEPGEDTKLSHTEHRSKVLDEQARTVFVGGIPWACTKETLTKDFTECGSIEIMRIPANADGVLKGIAFITYKTMEGVEGALKFNGEDYGGRTLQVNLVTERPSKGGGKGTGRGFASDGDCGKAAGRGGRGTGKGPPMDAEAKALQDKLTVVIKCLPHAATKEVVQKDFEEMGEIERFNMTSAGIAFVLYKSHEAVEKALKFDSTEYGGRWIRVERIGEGQAPGKGKKGKGKGKGETHDMESAPAESKNVKTFSDSDDE